MTIIMYAHVLTSSESLVLLCGVCVLMEHTYSIPKKEGELTVLRALYME